MANWVHELARVALGLAAAAAGGVAYWFVRDVLRGGR